MNPIWYSLVVIAIFCACRVDGREINKDVHDPDDPSSPDYKLTAEHYPRYSTLTRKHKYDEIMEASSDSPTIEDVANLADAANEEPLRTDEPKAESLKQNEDLGSNDYADLMFIGIVAGCSTLAAFAIVSTGYCVYRVHQKQRMAQDVDYPAYGITGPMKNAMGSPPADRKLAQSAQMYHFQHQKQQMIAVEKSQQSVVPPASRRGSHSEGESDDEDKDYTVYECPGLAPGGQMEVRNPMFNDRKPSK